MSRNSSSYSTFFPPASTAPIEIVQSDLRDMGIAGTIKDGQLYLIADSSAAFGMGQNTLQILCTGRPDGKGVLAEAVGGFLNADFQRVGDYSVAAGTQKGIWNLALEGGLVDNDFVIWDNQHFIVDSHSGSHDGTYPKDGVNGYSIHPKSEGINWGYILEYDKIIYDLTTDTILWRIDKRNNKINNASLVTWDWGNNASLNYRQEDNCTVNGLNNSGRILSGRQIGDTSTVIINENKQDIFIDISSREGVINCPNNSGTLELHVTGFSSGAQGSNNSGEVKVYINDQSLVSFNNNTGDIYGRYADGANWNYDNNTLDWEFVDATNGSNGNIIFPEVFGQQGGSKSKYLQSKYHDEWGDLLNINSLPKGQFVFIHKSGLSDVPTDLGIRIFCETANTFSLQASGLFLNPDYQAVGNYDGLFDVTGIAFDSMQGVWFAGGEGVNINNTVCVIWNGLHYQCIDSSAQDGTAPDINTAAYQILPKSATNVGYILEADSIEYDFAANYLVSRADKRGAIINDDAIDGTNTITLYQWGNDNVRANIVEAGSQLNNLNQTGSMLSNRLSGGSIVDCSTNAGTVSNNNITNASILIMNITVGRNIGGCFFDSAATFDLSAIAVDYYRKTLYPHLSTFDAVIDCDIALDVDKVLATSEYVGDVTIVSSNPTEIVKGFSTNPTFKRKVRCSGVNITFDNSGSINPLIFPTPSTSTTISGDEASFIEFLYNSPLVGFIQIASEQY